MSRNYDDTKTLAVCVKALSRLNVGVAEHDLLRERLRNGAEKEEIEPLRTIQDDRDIREALVQATLQDFNMDYDGHSEETQDFNDGDKYDDIVAPLLSEAESFFF